MKFFISMAFLVAYAYAVPAGIDAGNPLGGLGGLPGGIGGLAGAVPGGDQMAVLKAAPGADALKGLPTDKLGDMTGSLGDISGKTGLGSGLGGLPGGLGR